MLVSAAEEGEIVAVLDDRLIAAAGERHFDRQGGEIVILAEIHAVLADADGDGGSNAGGVGHLAHRFEQGELVLRHARQLLRLKQQQEAVALQPPQKPAVFIRPLADAGVDLRVQTGDRRVGQVVGQLVIVVHQDDGEHRTRADVLVAHLKQLRQILQIDHAHNDARLGVPLGQNRARDAEAAVAVAQLAGHRVLAGQEPLHRKAGQNFVDPLRREGVAHTCQLREGLVVPNQLLLVELYERNGEGNIAVGGAAHHFVGRADVLRQRVTAALAAPLVAQQQKQRRADLISGIRRISSGGTPAHRTRAAPQNTPPYSAASFAAVFYSSSHRSSPNNGESRILQSLYQIISLFSTVSFPEFSPFSKKCILRRPFML